MMQSMTRYKFGDVVLVPFPFTDQRVIKKRPAVIISSERYQNSHPDLILMAVTSQQQTLMIPDHIQIVNWQAAGLAKPSVVKPIVMMLEQQLVIRVLGRLKKDGFHVQQCAEKYLKGRLQEEDIRFSKTHDLEILLDLLLFIESEWNILHPSYEGVQNLWRRFPVPRNFC